MIKNPTARLGAFLNNRISYHGRFRYYKKEDFSSHMVYHTIFIQVFIVLCLFNLTSLLLTKDPAIEWNPGPETIRKLHLHQIKRKSYFSV